MAAKSKAESVELHAHAIECRVTGEKLTLVPVQFQIDQGLKAEQPQLVMYLRGCPTAAEALSMLKAVIKRIERDGLPNMKIVLPGEIVGPLDGIFERIRQLPESVRDG